MFRLMAAFALCAWLLKGTPQAASNPPVIPPPRLPASSELLHAAVRSGNLAEAKRLIALGADVNARDVPGNTPLLYAAWSGNAATTSFLLAHGADVNAQQSGPAALQWAVLAGRTAAVKLLLAAGAHVDVRDLDGRTLLHVAARYGYDQIAELLLLAHAEADSTDATGHTPLDEAVLFAQASVVPVLLRHGADPKRVRLQDGRGPLQEACIKGSAALIEILVKAGADPAERDKSGQTAIDLALAYKNEGAIAALEHLALERKDCRTAAENAMESATLRGRTEIARLLINGGFDLNQWSSGGSTYLHQAALKGQKPMVQLFLDRGVDSNSLDAAGGTPLHNAALAGATEVITLLLDRGARIDTGDRESGATPLMLAASVSRTGAVALLLGRGANPGLRDSTGRTALDRARETDDRDTVKLLESALERATPARKTAV